MTDSKKVRKAAGVSQTLSISLLVAGVASAGLVAFVTRGTNPVPKNRPAAHAPKLVEKAAKRELPSSEKARPHEESAAELMLEGAPAPAEKVAELDVPTVEEALRLRRRSVVPRRDIVEHGVVALLDRPRCKAPAELVETGRSGEGIYGCVIATPEGAPHVVGRAVHRKANGHLEVGNYESGQRSGEWEQYYPTGLLAAVGRFEKDQRDGTWHEYDETGEHRFSRSYSAGRKHGAVVRYLGETAQIDLYFEGGQYDPESKEPVLRTEIAEAP